MLNSTCTGAATAGGRPRSTVKLPAEGVRVLRNSVTLDRQQVGALDRRALLTAATWLVAGSAFAGASTSPYEDAKSMQYGLDTDRSCNANAPAGTQCLWSEGGTSTYQRDKRIAGVLEPALAQ